MLNFKTLRNLNSNFEKHQVIGRTVQVENNIEAFSKTQYNKNEKSLIVAGTENYAEKKLDISWLNAASETYQISSDPNDYILIPIPIVTVDIPNRNMQGFPYEEVTYFDPLLGRLVYSTFKGKPTHIDHKNQNPLAAKGVNFDVSMQFIPAYNIWKIVVLSGFCRQKDEKLVNDILSKKRSSYSMGALVEHFVCSICGTVDEGPGRNRCRHMENKGELFDNRLAYQLCIGVNYIENSSVEDPADPTAYSSDIMTFI